MTTWEYLLVSLPVFGTPKLTQGASSAVAMLNQEGKDGWEAIGLTTLDNGECAVLMKRPLRNVDGTAPLPPAPREGATVLAIDVQPDPADSTTDGHPS
jgi:hypothetical protein